MQHEPYNKVIIFYDNSLAIGLPCTDKIIKLELPKYEQYNLIKKTLVLNKQCSTYFVSLKYKQ